MSDILDGSKWKLVQEDCITHMASMPTASVDFAVFSPPFPSLFAYTDEACDIGNNDDVKNEGKIHLSFFYRQLARIVKPGRVIMVHVMQIPGLARNGQVGTFDFRGLNIRLGNRAGLHYIYDWCYTKNPQAQAIRTHSHKLLFVSLERDRAISCGAMPDYLIKFLVPGTNAVAINSKGEISRNDWIQWAEAAWSYRDCPETDTLNTDMAKGENDTKHICPLQRGIIRRLVKLYTNPGEIVFSPFGGIGSEGVVAVSLGRRSYACEIKDEYVKQYQKNIAKAERECAENSRTMFDEIESDDVAPSGQEGESEAESSVSDELASVTEDLI